MGIFRYMLILPSQMRGILFQKFVTHHLAVGSKHRVIKGAGLLWDEILRKIVNVNLLLPLET